MPGVGPQTSSLPALLSQVPGQPLQFLAPLAAEFRIDAPILVVGSVPGMIGQHDPVPFRFQTLRASVLERACGAGKQRLRGKQSVLAGAFCRNIARQSDWPHIPRMAEVSAQCRQRRFRCIHCVEKHRQRGVNEPGVEPGLRVVTDDRVRKTGRAVSIGGIVISMRAARQDQRRRVIVQLLIMRQPFSSDSPGLFEDVGALDIVRGRRREFVHHYANPSAVRSFPNEERRVLERRKCRVEVVVRD